MKTFLMSAPRRVLLKQSGRHNKRIVLVVVVVDVAIRVDIPSVVATVDSTQPRITVVSTKRTVCFMFRNNIISDGKPSFLKVYPFLFLLSAY